VEHRGTKRRRDYEKLNDLCAPLHGAVLGEAFSALLTLMFISFSGQGPGLVSRNLGTRTIG